MKKILSFLSENILFIITLFLLAFIPLYPKLPLIDIKNTWVYIRVEDFLVLLALLTWLTLLVKKKVTLKTPATIPILTFWIIGAIATIHGVILVFPTDANVFPNVAFLTFLRHIEYLSLFFVAFSSIRSKKHIWMVVTVLALTLLGVVLYGLGQKYAGFPAYLTMNEEFAKGIPIRLSELSRLPSTFAGQYDLAAYLVLIIPILVSMVFGVKNWIGKAALLLVSLSGFGLLFMTVSRVSFVVLLVALFCLLFFQKKRFVLYSIPFVVVFGFLFFIFSGSLLARFGNTLKTVDVLVDGKTGAAVGEVRFVPVEYFHDKVIKQERISTEDELVSAVSGEPGSSTASPSAILPFELLLPMGQVPLVTAANVSNGESLPQGTGYTNLALSPVVKRVGNFFYELPPNIASKTSTQVLILHGDFIIKRAVAYDLSFTTRFQGEWPHATLAFERNILVGSGYGSVSLAVDNNYLRMLAETGILGTLAFFAIFVAMGIYIKKILADIDSPVARNFVLGVAAGIIGLSLNATLIDVFEASKIAYLLWMLIGITFGVLILYQKKEIKLLAEFKNIATSTYAVIVYLFIVAIVIFSPMLGNYFVGDDFTWLRWAADCTEAGLKVCTAPNMILHYFTESSGFFYRPGTKTFFYFMYQFFWLNQVVYHVVSIALHALVAVLFFFLAKKILKNSLVAAGAASLFLVMSGYAEIVYWSAALGHLFNAAFILAALIMFTLWREKKQPVFYVLALISAGLSLLFHELGMVVPLLIILYQAVFDETFNIRKFFKQKEYLALFIPDVIYLLARLASHSHWQGGDYSYNLVKLPFNLIGNAFGYLILSLFGPLTLPIYEKIRDLTRAHVPFALIGALVVVGILTFGYLKLWKKIEHEDKKIIVFGTLFFLICLLPFLGLGNITSRYSYLASLGLVLIFVFAIQKLYSYLTHQGKEIAAASIVVVVVTFSLLHIIQVEQIQLDWHGAGQQAQSFLTAIDDSYSNYFSTEPMVMHFVNVPTKVGQAWVFPVGIEDILWFAFKNPNLKVYQDPQVTRELQKQISRNFRVFQFNGDGSVTEVQPPKVIVPTPSVVTAPKIEPKVTPTKSSY